ncbi:L-rhamnose mutarotase [Microbacterium sp. ASV49]|uniref:L-rhamnose mutarotase n=1 Tax=Microbacterium candidum TaxID=3041922 RepID=A0ABT7MTP4_9MICO|nr:L-rhamnose mutarotase [Microbacterium sp. ASV49]MDL9977803.1 L-rhamnose mutarotase [Microbacterium sp. ASV49]
MRVALHSILREGHEVAYEEDHAAIPDDLVAAFARLDIHDWTIWRSGRHLFHLVDCDDFTAAIVALGTDPANEDWQRVIGRHVERFVDPPEGVGMPQVWSLTRQRA